MLTPRHPFFPKFREILRVAAAQTPVFDLGTSGRFAKELSFVSELFDESQYIAGGYSDDLSLVPEGCDIACDVEDLSNLSDSCAGAVLSMQVLEHVRNPGRAVHEMFRVLRPGGVAVVAVPFLSSYHGKRELPKAQSFRTDQLVSGGTSEHDYYGDYWRFTHEGLVSLLLEGGFSSVEVWPVDGPVISRLEFLKLFKWISRVPLLREAVAKLDSPRLGKATSGHFALAYRQG